MAPVAAFQHFLSPTNRGIFSLPAFSRTNASPKIERHRLHRTLKASANLEDAAEQTVSYFVRSGMTLGLGTGPASCMAIKHLGNRIRDGSLKNIKGIAMSSFSAAEAAKAGVPLLSFSDGRPKIDFAFDDVDIVQEGTLYALVGRKGAIGRESIIKEKSMAKAADQLVFIVDEARFVAELDGAVFYSDSTGCSLHCMHLVVCFPHEFVNFLLQKNWMDVAEEIDDLFLGDAEVWRRPSHGDASPMGGDFPFITNEGHFILDVIFSSPIANAAQIVEEIESVDGVVEHGFILDTAYAAAVAGKDGVKIRTSLFKDAFTHS